MKKFVALLILVISLVTVMPVSAQGSSGSSAPGNWTSSISIFNTGAEEAIVTLTFYDSDGVAAAIHTIDPPIPANGSVYLYSSEFTELPDGEFSLVVSSSQPVTTVASQTSTSPRTAGAYSGFGASETSTSLFFPGLYNSYYTFNSELVLQNTTSTAAEISINFYKQLTGEIIDTVTATIPGNATRVFYLHDLPTVPSGNYDGLISAQVSSDQPIVGITDIWSPRVFSLFSNYNGFISGTTDTLYAPALYKYYYNFVSALTIQNIDSSAEPQDAEVRITYSNGVVRTATLAPYQSREFYQPNDTSLPSGNSSGVFSAKVESVNNVPIVALVSVESKAKGLLASYNASTSASTSLNCPLVYRDYFKWFSAETVQNVGTEATDITITYSVGDGAYIRTFYNVPPNGTINIIELENAGSLLPSGTAASAIITSSGQPIISVVQLNNELVYPSAPGDYLEAYTCSPVVP